MPKESISKLDAAKRQLDTAIELFFKESDTISIHTLATATLEILRDLGEKNNIPTITKGFALQIIKTEKHKKYISIINEAQNFFKHADRDNKEILLFNAEQTTIVLFDACETYFAITKRLSNLMYLYKFWFIVNNPNVITDKKIIAQLLTLLDEFHIDPKDKSLFLSVAPKLQNPFA